MLEIYVLPTDSNQRALETLNATLVLPTHDSLVERPRLDASKDFLVGYYVPTQGSINTNEIGD
jgi:hypothetical protein